MLFKGFRSIIYGVGLYQTSLYTGQPLYHLFHQITTNTENYVKENSILNATKGSYVAVTGCTDGIGKELSLEFARRGYPLYMLARNTSKLESVKLEAPKSYSNLDHIIK